MKCVNTGPRVTGIGTTSTSKRNASCWPSPEKSQMQVRRGAAALLPEDLVSSAFYRGYAITADLRTAALPQSISGLCGRGPIEQRAMPGTDHRMHNRHRNRGRSAHEDHWRRDHSHRSGRVHHHAKGAMVRVRGYRVHVRNLDKRQQCQQHQANQRSGTHSPRLAANSSQIAAYMQTQLPLLTEYTNLTRAPCNSLYER